MLSAGPNLARSDYLPLLSSCKMTSEVLCLVLGSPKGRDILKSIPEISQRVPTIYTEGWSRGCMRRSRRAVEMKKKWLGDLAAVYSYLMGGGREVKAKLFSKVHSESSRSSRHRLEQMKLWSSITGGKKNTPCVWSNTDTNCPEWLWHLHPQRYSKLDWKRTWAGPLEQQIGLGVLSSPF